MTRTERIHADFLVLIRDDPLYPRHPRSINPHAHLKTALSDARGIENVR